MIVWPLEIGLSHPQGPFIIGESLNRLSKADVMHAYLYVSAHLGKRYGSTFDDYDLTAVPGQDFRRRLLRAIERHSEKELSVYQVLETLASVMSGSQGESGRPRVAVFDVKVYWQHVVMLLKASPRLRIIVVIRDPRDVYLTYRTKQFVLAGVGNYNHLHGIPFLKFMVDHFRQYGWYNVPESVLHHDRVLVVQHNDLVANRLTVLNAITRWLECASFWDTMHQTTRLGLPIKLDRFRTYSGQAGKSSIQSRTAIFHFRELEDYWADHVRTLPSVRDAQVVRSALVVWLGPLSRNIQAIECLLLDLGATIHFSGLVSDRLSGAEQVMIDRLILGHADSHCGGRSVVSGILKATWCALFSLFPGELAYYGQLWRIHRAPRRLIAHVIRSAIQNRIFLLIQLWSQIMRLRGLRRI